MQQLCSNFLLRVRATVWVEFEDLASSSCFVPIPLRLNCVPIEEFDCIWMYLHEFAYKNPVLSELIIWNVRYELKFLKSSLGRLISEKYVEKEATLYFSL